ncbi:MAG: hypothetical protein ACRED5_00165 [Propylenella sp.]
MSGSRGHMTTWHVRATADAAFRYLCDPIALGHWSLGCFDTQPAEEPGLYTGRSLIDGSQAWFRIDADPARLLIDYLVGAPDRLVRRISARIVPGAELSLPAETCLVSLIAWRPAGISDENWRRVQALHEAEIILIAGQIERDSAPPSASG